jgi:hypothetical protein
MKSVFLLLPADVANGASLRGNEYGWRVSAFPEAVAAAKSHVLACLGGQFQFRLPESIYEMYWLSADSTDRCSEESWMEYSQRSCSEVLDQFNRLVSKTDFVREAANWRLDASAVESLAFVAYFETQASLAELSASQEEQI